ncbi:MAG: glycosyltransferase [archaeon]|nr:glycosyltransferase [archaeon]
MQPKILIGIPTHEVMASSLEEFITNLKSLTYENFEICIEDNSPNLDYYNKLQKIAEEWNKIKKQKFSVIHSIPLPKARQRIVNARNLLRKKFLEEGFDYFFSLEQDVIPPINVLETLLSRNEKIISGVYFVPRKKINGLEIVAYKFLHTKSFNTANLSPLNFLELMPSRVIKELAFTGVGCQLIAREVLEKIQYRYDDSLMQTDDYFFGVDAFKHNYSICLDSSVLCKHFFDQWFGTKIKIEDY